MSDHPANADQIRYWNEDQGPKWVAYQEALDAVLAPFTDVLLGAAALRRGERVLDIGTGCGASALEAARAVGREGRVTGLDVSVPMSAHARTRAAALAETEPDAAPVTFEVADAAVYNWPAGPSDVAISRFGMMFFDAPDAAFSNLRRGLTRGGRQVFVAWQGLFENQWVSVPLTTMLEHVPAPEPPPPGAPGPFAFADPERVRAILDSAGFTDIAITPFTAAMRLGADAEEAARFAVEMGPASRLAREADPAAVPTLTAALEEAMRPHEGPGGVHLEGAVWVVSARA